MYVHTPHSPANPYRRKDDGLATRCLFTPYCEVESSEFKLELPPAPPASRQGVKNVQLYQRVGPRDVFGCRLNVLRLCLYNNSAAVRGCLCSIPL